MYQFIENIKSDKTFFFYRGTVALYALLRAMEIGPGDEVILQVFTCPAVPSPIVRLGATPVYVDIDPGSFNMDPDKIEAKITEKTKAIIVQHTFGIPAEMDPILDLARKYNLRVIEDSCHAFGSRYNGREVGTFGDAAFYSFGWYKPVVLGVGGAAVVNSPILKQRMEELYDDFVVPPKTEMIVLYVQYFAYTLLLRPSLFWFMRNVYRKLSQQGLIAGTSRRKRGETARSGRTGTARSGKVAGKRMIPFQEKRLFRKLDDFVQRTIPYQKWVVSRYEELVSQIGYEPLELDGRFEPVYYKYPLLADCNKDIVEKASQVQVELSNMFVSPLYPPGWAAIWKSLGYQKGLCPISEDVSDRIIALPIHAKVQAKDIERTIAFLASFQ